MQYSTLLSAVQVSCPSRNIAGYGGQNAAAGRWATIQYSLVSTLNCTLYIVHIALYKLLMSWWTSVQYTPPSAQNSVQCRVHNTLYSAQNSVQCTKQCTLWPREQPGGTCHCLVPRSSASILIQHCTDLHTTHLWSAHYTLLIFTQHNVLNTVLICTLHTPDLHTSQCTECSERQTQNPGLAQAQQDFGYPSWAWLGLWNNLLFNW